MHTIGFAICKKKTNLLIRNTLTYIDYYFRYYNQRTYLKNRGSLIIVKLSLCRKSSLQVNEL